MSVQIPNIRVGEPACYEALTVFPLFSDNNGDGVPYALADEAIAAETLTVTEVSEGGSVPDLLVENRGDSRVLFLEGEQLIGAKQNRMLNLSLLVAAHSKIPIPVSCVEQGRWKYRSRHFSSGATHSPAKLRHLLKRSVYASVKARRGHGSDQGEIWKEVHRQQQSLGTDSPSSALADTFRECDTKIEQFRDSLRPVDGAVGLAVAVGGRIVSIDLLDKSETCAKVWDRLLSGLILDAIEAKADAGQATAKDADAFLTSINGLSWEPVETVGEGIDFRAETENLVASALTFDGTVVHASVSVAV